MQMTSKPIQVSIVGSGNVATRLCHAFQNAGVELRQLVSASASGKELAKSFGMELLTTPKNIKKVDVVLLCITDDALQGDFLSQFDKSLFLCHTSGSVSINIFDSWNKGGVFYPLQTLSKAKEVAFNNIPICVESKEEKGLFILKALANSISQDIRIINSEERKRIHLAAVFVSNFANHLYKIAEDLLSENNINFDILKPLIAETAEKIQTISPAQAQTGPALRGDELIIKNHLESLSLHPNYQNIYKIISASIARNN